MFEAYLNRAGFVSEELHTSGHASVLDIRKVIEGLEPKQVIPIHTMRLEAFTDMTGRAVLREDGKAFNL